MTSLQMLVVCAAGVVLALHPAVMCAVRQRAGYLVDPDEGSNGYFELENRAVQHTTELAPGIELDWNGTTIVGITVDWPEARV